MDDYDFLTDVIPSEDLKELRKHYFKLNKKGFVEGVFLNVVKSIFDKKGYSFKEYIDAETHRAMIKFGFIDSTEESQKVFGNIYRGYRLWGDRYGLTDEGYKALRSVTLEKFVKNTMNVIDEKFKKQGILGISDNIHDFMVPLTP
ncbi:MAG: hypothetical protein ABIJ14_00325 [Nanoarchaeota archaeon]|nr:hypothetical protein [Nanoarchaeota archaeon]